MLEVLVSRASAAISVTLCRLHGIVRAKSSVRCSTIDVFPCNTIYFFTYASQAVASTVVALFYIVHVVSQSVVFKLVYLFCQFFTVLAAGIFCLCWRHSHVDEKSNTIQTTESAAKNFIVYWSNFLFLLLIPPKYVPQYNYSQKQVERFMSVAGVGKNNRGQAKMRAKKNTSAVIEV